MTSMHVIPAPGTGAAPDLRARYERYRLGEALDFLHLVPRDGVRALYAEARSWAKKEGMHDGRSPMDSLLRYLLMRLPLPTFEVWRADLQRAPIEHAVRASETASGQAGPSSVTIASRAFQHHRRRWEAGLNVFPDGDRWRGYISFAQPVKRSERTDVRTADIFLEPDPATIREAFQGYRSDTLAGLLRSSLS